LIISSVVPIFPKIPAMSSHRSVIERAEQRSTLPQIHT
jgi:hypothetical protein